MNEEDQLPSITPLSGDLEKEQAIHSYIQYATSDNTRKAYRSDIRHYEAWGGKLPATSKMLMQYLYFYADKLNPRTLERRLVAIKHWHRYQYLPDPTSDANIQKTLAGISRKHGKPESKARALLPEELTALHHYLSGLDTFAAARDDALLQIGFFGALRRSELVMIQVENITWDKAGIEIQLPVSKTDQEHAGQYCVIPYGNDAICPLAALTHWLEMSKIEKGYIFPRIHAGQKLGTTPLTPLSVNHILKKQAHAAGLHDIESLSSHSLRRGLATSAARAGSSLQAIMRSGRWKQTNTVMKYIEASERFQDNAAGDVLQTFIKVK